MANIAGMFAGLNQAIRGFGGTQGQPVPQDPNQRNALERVGVTNPMLQMFGQGLGALTGTEMRSEADIFKQTAAGLDVSTPEGRAEYLRALSRLNPEAAVQQAMKFKEADESSEVKRAQAAKYKQDIENGNIRTGSRTERVPMLDKFGDPVLDESGKPIYTEKNVQVTQRRIGDDWFEVEPDKTGKLVPVRQISESEVLEPKKDKMRGTTIRYQGQTYQALIDADGDYIIEVNGKEYTIPKEKIQDMNVVDTPPPAPSALQTPSAPARGTGGRSGRVMSPQPQQGMLTGSQGFNPRTRSGR